MAPLKAKHNGDMMTKTNFRNVDEYIAAQPAPAQVVLESVRSAIRTALPDAEEVISYKIPAYKVTGVVVLYLRAGSSTIPSIPPASDVSRR